MWIFSVIGFLSWNTHIKNRFGDSLSELQMIRSDNLYLLSPIQSVSFENLSKEKELIYDIQIFWDAPILRVLKINENDT